MKNYKIEKCIICDKDANMNKNKNSTKIYEVVLQIKNKTLYLHNGCFLDLSMVIKNIHQSYIDEIKNEEKKCYSKRN